MTHARELLASAQMRDRIAAFLEHEAALRDRKRSDGRPPAEGKSRLLYAMAQLVRAFPAELAHGELPAGGGVSPEMQALIRKVSA